MPSYTSDFPSFICKAEPTTYTKNYENITFHIMYGVILSLLFNRLLLIIFLINYSSALCAL